MNDRVDREKALLDAALQMPTPAERVAFVKGACVDDDALRRRLEALLKARAEAATLSRKLSSERAADILN